MHLDPFEGLVCIPSHLVDEVLDLVPLLGQADEKVKGDVMQGIGVQEAFGRHRMYIFLFLVLLSLFVQLFVSGR